MILQAVDLCEPVSKAFIFKDFIFVPLWAFEVLFAH